MLEFVAEEGRIYIPYWMFRLLCLEPGQKVTVKSATIPKGEYVKFQPQSTDFVEIHNPKVRIFLLVTSHKVWDIIPYMYTTP